MREVGSHMRSNAVLVRHVGKLRYFRARNSFKASSQRCILNLLFPQSSCRLRSAMTEPDAPKVTSCYIIACIILQNANLKPYPAANACLLITPVLLISSTDPADHHNLGSCLRPLPDTQPAPVWVGVSHRACWAVGSSGGRLPLRQLLCRPGLLPLCTLPRFSPHSERLHGLKGLLLVDLLLPQHGAWLASTMQPSKSVDSCRLSSMYRVREEKWMQSFIKSKGTLKNTLSSSTQARSHIHWLQDTAPAEMFPT